MNRLICYAFALLLPSSAFGASSGIILQSTTSTQNSGLYDAILPAFEQSSGVEVKVVAVGTGQAIKNAINCDADVLLVHAKAAEEKFVNDGYGMARFDVMYNDFVIIGPAEDPAGLLGTETISEALTKLAETEYPFASRGDDSGTHKKESSLWEAAGIDPTIHSGQWYRETGSGMGATLNVAVGMQAYTMSDRATWLAFENKGSHRIVYETDPALFNQYGVILVNPDHCPKANVTDGQTFIDWLLGEGQAEIGAYRRSGEQLFFPNAQ